MKKIFLDEINRRAGRDASEFVAECEAKYGEKVLKAAELIKERLNGHPIVLLSGPSGSGKTTTAMRIVECLKKGGVGSHSISMDDYFLTRSEYKAPKDEEGNDDLESPLCLDIELLNEHLGMLAQGREINVPKYDFTRQRRSEQTSPLKLRHDEVVVIEGIHALNPDVMGRMFGYSTGIYVSMRTRIEQPDGNLIAPEYMRIMRRVVRDHHTRNRDALGTINAWKSVRRGELLYILPHKHNAMVSIDTLIPYEGCVIAGDAKELVYAIPEEIRAEGDVNTISNIVLMFERIDRSLVPADSLLNEFLK